ncbi:fluoride efflux transporter CrcB [Microbacteriaceae bacterium VKM Ac-2855]|nr:fluoride efflux transporter CrcB [Microbacteriaceae bacterium VKM Ac-2855]
MSVLMAAAVLLAGAVAATARYAVGLFFARRSRTARVFPWGVFVVNVVASFIAGVATGLASVSAVSPELQLLLVTGVAGGLSTFSTFGVDTMALVAEKRFRAAAVVVLANLAAGLAAVVLGLVVGRAF